MSQPIQAAEWMALHTRKANCGMLKNATSWHDFKDSRGEERIDQPWEKSAEHRGGFGMAKGVHISVCTKHYKNTVKHCRTCEAAAFISLATRALWSPARLGEAHDVERHKCSICGKLDSDEGRHFLGVSQSLSEPRRTCTKRYCSEYTRHGLGMNC